MITGFGLSVPFYIISALALVVIISSYIFIPQAVASSDIRERKVRLSYGGLLRGSILKISLSAVLLMSGTYGIFSIMGFFIQDRFNLETIEVAQMLGVGLMCAAAANVFVQTFLIKIIRVRLKWLISIGISLSMCSIALLWFYESESVFFLAMLFNGLGLGFSMPALNTALSLSASSQDQGRIAGISTACQSIAFLIAPMSSAALYQFIPILPFVFAACLIVLAQFIVLRTVVVDAIR